MIRMTIVGSGNMTGFHYSKQNCEEIIRKYFKDQGFPIKDYNIPFVLARKLAEAIRSEPFYIKYFNKRYVLEKEYVDGMVNGKLITLEE